MLCGCNRNNNNNKSNDMNNSSSIKNSKNATPITLYTAGNRDSTLQASVHCYCVSYYCYALLLLQVYIGLGGMHNAGHRAGNNKNSNNATTTTVTKPKTNNTSQS